MKERITVIADAGSSKIDWAFLSDNGKLINRLQTNGLNILLADNSTIIENFRSVSLTIEPEQVVSRVYYYGAGCANQELCNRVLSAISEVWPTADGKVYSDLLAACHALLGKKPGIACILGTGSNSALFNGEEIIGNIPPLGFILGDEGSGANLGKSLITEIYKGILPEKLKEDFFDEYKISLANILQRVYREPMPNKFLASFVPFIRKHIDSPLIYNMVLGAFKDFFRRNVCLYANYDSMPVAFTGSVAFFFEPILRDAAKFYNVDISSISQAPLKALIDYHRNL